MTKATNTISIIALLVAASASLVEGGFLGHFKFLHTHEDEPDHTATEEQTPLEAVGAVLTVAQLDTGRRGFACLQYAANVENDPFESLGMMLRPITRVLLNYYGEYGIDKLCSMTHHGRALLQEAGKEIPEWHGILEQKLDNKIPDHGSSQQKREMTTCDVNSATYPADPAVDTTGIYADYASKYLDHYLPDGDRNQRSDNAYVAEKVNNDLNYFRGVRVGLNSCVTIWTGVNQLIALADVPFIDQDKISESIMSFSCGLPNRYNDIVISRNERNLERISFHDHVVDGTEVGAIYLNSHTMMNNLCALQTAMESASEEVEDIHANLTTRV
ncbi:expressed unknown protein [Seminavis robusta]|uniref:Uncharacterized protein n=1 Tax=Seminavis robusta TaxID=568900 RepID=A0A9N8E3L1_9STRA|nr:expressed unknown protein [Seminavis robusta]|eukprot:Sro614_g175790.1 n/a (330) ;mRNA; f:43676-44665